MNLKSLLPFTVISFITIQAQSQNKFIPTWNDGGEQHIKPLKGENDAGIPQNTTKICVRPVGKTSVYLYHPTTEKWYVSEGYEQLSDSDPCYKDQHRDEGCDGSVVGSCECIQGLGMSVCNSTPENGRPVGKSSDGKCYPLYTMANCRRRFWLTLNSEGQPTCNKNVCQREFYSLYPNWLKIKIQQVNQYLGRLDVEDVKVLPEGYSYKGSCYRTLTQGHCPNNKQTAIFATYKSEPNCVEIFDRAGQLQQFCCGFGGGYLGYGESPVCPVNYYRHGSDCLKERAASMEFAEE